MMRKPSVLVCCFLLFGSYFFSGAGALDPCVDADGFPAPSSSAASIQSDRTIAAGQVLEFDCKEVVVRGNITVASGGELRITNSILKFDPQTTTPLNLTTQDGGLLNVTGSSAIMPHPTNMTGIRIYLAPGAKSGAGGVHDLWLAQIDSFIVASSAVVFKGLYVDTATSTCLRISNASPTFEALVLHDCPRGVLVDGSSAPTFLAAMTEEVSLIGLQAGPSSKIVSELSTWSSANTGVYLLGDARMNHRNGSFGSAPQHANLASAAGKSPHLILEGTSFDASAVALDGASRLDSYCFLRARTVWGSGADAGDLVDGADVFVQNATGIRQAAAQTGSDGMTAVLRLPMQNLRATWATDHNDYTFDATKASSVAPLHEQSIGCEPAMMVELELVADEDDEGPIWPNANALGAASSSTSCPTPKACSNNGRVELTWQPANDQPTDASPNRAVRHYEVHRVFPEDPKVFRVDQTQFIDVGRPNGTHSYRVIAYDRSGNPSAVSNQVVVEVDRESPWLNWVFNLTQNHVPLHFNDTFNVTLTSGDNRTGPPTIRYQLGGAAEQAYTVPFDVLAVGTTAIKVKSTDNAGVVREETKSVVIDRTKPVVGFALSPATANTADGWYTTAPTLTVTGSDSTPGILHKRQYQIGTAGTWQDYTNPVRIDQSGDHTVSVRAIDGAGNKATSQVRLPIDLSVPVLAANATGTVGDAGWFRSPVTIQATATDVGSGVKHLSYRNGQSAWLEFENPLRLTESGPHSLTLRALDKAGNPSVEVKKTVNIDRIAPLPPEPLWRVIEDGTVIGNWSIAPAADLHSGVSRMQVETSLPDGKSIGLDPTARGGLIGPLPRGLVSLRVRVYDAAGNDAASPWIPVQINTTTARAQDIQIGTVRATDVTLVHYEPPGDVSIEEVSFFLDDQLLFATSEPPYQISWDTRRVPDGVYTISMVAHDSAGHTYQSAKTYEVRNEYGHVLMDEAPMVVLSALPALLGAVLSVAGYAMWRRWESA